MMCPKRRRNISSTISNSWSNILPISAISPPPSMPCDNDMRQWLSEHLKLDYTERNNASQFRRAMREHGRYTPQVRDEVIALESMGYFRFQALAEE